jgi:hypothetical protein
MPIQRFLRISIKLIYLSCALLIVLAASTSVLAQTGSLRGQVTDQNGAVLAGAKVTAYGPNGVVKTATTDKGGSYAFTGLAPGDYVVQAAAPSLVMAEPAKITLGSGVQTLNLQLTVVLPEQKVTVEAEGAPAINTESSGNASAQVLRGTDLDALGDSPEDLQADLLALAGPSAGPSGGAIYIDGFSGGELPPKNAIREIRINQNPFSPEYDKLGFGRIEILTKPGSGKLNGTFSYNFANRFWNSRNPYAQQKAPFTLNELGGNLSGPIGKRASFFLDVRRETVDNGSIVNAITLDPQTLAIVNPFTATPVTAQSRVNVNPRIDYQLNDKNTLVFRYSFAHSDIQDAGIGSLNLLSRAYENLNTSHTIQITETAVLSNTAINETRFQFYHTAGETIANSNDPALQVLGAFNAGGAQVGHSFSTQNSYELQNNTTISHGAHFWRFGVRVRRDSVSTISPQNFGGTFTFGGGNEIVLDPTNQVGCSVPAQPVIETITSIERYRRTLFFQKLGCSPAQIRALGGGATQFSINTGKPLISDSQSDVGAFVGDDWHVRHNLTVNVGLRYETQSNIHDWRDFAPRFGFAWALGEKNKESRPKSVLRGGFGVFYDRFALANTLTALRFNGVVQQQLVVSNPDFFPNVPAIASLNGFQTTHTIQQISPTLRAPYIVQSAVSFERQLPRNTTLAITYANAQGLHMLRSEDINAPLPGSVDPTKPGSGTFPLGKPGPVFLMESSGLYNQNQLIVNINSRFNKSVSFSGYYVLNFARSNTDGLGTFPAKPGDFTGEYGPAANDVRRRLSVNGTINARWNVRFSPFIVVESGPPFDITAGRDVYGTTLFNARPGIPTDTGKPGLIQTKYGLLDPNPTPDEKILPRNFGRGPGSVTVNLRVAKIIEFGASREGGGGPSSGPGGGPGGGGPGGRGTPGVFTPQPQGGSPSGASHRYSLSISMSIRNLLNHTNPGPIIGNITSPLFGQANQAAGGGGGFSEAANNRRLEMQVRFSF